MQKKKLILSTFALVAVLVWLYPSEQPYKFRQVKRLAIAEENYLLPISPHISQVIRPKEIFDFPIKLGAVGPSNSLYSGPKQYPFYCMTIDSHIGQPLVDNQEGYGVPIYENLVTRNDIIGYSKDCLFESHLQFYYLNLDDNLVKLAVEQFSQLTTLRDAKHPLQLFRAEQGSINRFIYTIAMAITPEELGTRMASSLWNKKLIYQFNGGSGIGFRQGRQKAARTITRRLIEVQKGYAIISSSGNRTSYTYNMLLAEDTARRVKLHFVSLFGEPLYTVGIGGSGGGLAQYLIGQNSHGILDGLIPQYSYPDMVSQTIYTLDCDLFNNYFTFRAKDNNRWQQWDQRQLLEGMNSLQDYPQKIAFLQPVAQLMAGMVPSFPQGNSECINGYFGLSTFIHNPRQGFLRHFYSDDVVENTNWNYWEDMAWLFKRDQHGLVESTWDNDGVQYGLHALKQKQITLAEFVHINKNIGSWKEQYQMKAEKIITPFGRKMPFWVSLWGSENITEVIDNKVAPRRSAPLHAIEMAYRGGQVFIGKLELPIIDVRHYLEEKLDMHHMSASFSTRIRLQQANGHFNNQIIWVAKRDFDPTDQAFDLMDLWLLKRNQFPELSAAQSKPVQLQDTCFDDKGQVLAQGQGVWNGNWNAVANGLKVLKRGACAKHYAIFSNSRIQAEGPWQGSIFKCHKIPLALAIKQGMYGDIKLAEQLTALQDIFSHGVCDYAQGDVGRPKDI
ncbi:DUF6351 family protein [Colwellia psychrerythraea]|uniref:DUF6351 domain-containing protein n=1 Tax=Colwellia psychrerythraea TaxID=28229 RepID=A0A099KQS5_COLPS|nr:DUF6351 family protein [Colwellia psychrerythraea]KGJ92242.1 hypothetical protein GAB14E_2830 [Colwellia psychrerythraea]